MLVLCLGEQRLEANLRPGFELVTVGKQLVHRLETCIEDVAFTGLHLWLGNVENMDDA